MIYLLLYNLFLVKNSLFSNILMLPEILSIKALEWFLTNLRLIKRFRTLLYERLLYKSHYNCSFDLKVIFLKMK